MDLRHFHASREQVEHAANLLRYQPFILDENRHTGVAYSWLYTSDPASATNQDFIFDRRSLPEDLWTKALAANMRLAAMYDAFIKRIVDMCPPNGSYLDFGCNNGYFPVSVSRAGIPTAVGVDLGDYTQQFMLLNQIVGASARFSVGRHDPSRHAISINETFGVQRFDVVSTSAVMCHLPDPLHFLRALAGLSSRALFIWNSFVETEELIIRYNPPNKFSDAEFPNGFDDCTSISLGLLRLSMSQLGFAHCEELTPEPEWMPVEWLRGAGLHAFLFSR